MLETILQRFSFTPHTVAEEFFFFFFFFFFVVVVFGFFGFFFFFFNSFSQILPIGCHVTNQIKRS